MGYWRRWLRTLNPAAGAVLAWMGAAGVHPAQTSFTLDPARSGMTLSGTLVAFGRTVPLGSQGPAQGPSSLVAACSGMLVVEREGDTVRFVTGSRVVPAEAGVWQPGEGGAEGFGPAGFAPNCDVPVGVFTAIANLAFRGAAFDVASPAVPLSDGGFSSALVGLAFGEGPAGHIDHRIVGALSVEGTQPLAGPLAGQPGLTGRIETGADGETITLPVDARYAFEVPTFLGPLHFQVTFQGQWVGTAAAVAGDPVVEWTPPADPGEPLTLRWPPGHRLEHTRTLSPPEWKELAADSPLLVPTTLDGGFFRAVRR